MMNKRETLIVCECGKKHIVRIENKVEIIRPTLDKQGKGKQLSPRND